MKVSWAAPWVFAIAALVILAISMSSGIDEAMGQETYTRHILLRKTYSVLAFALLGYVLTWSHKRTSTIALLLSGLAIGVFSGIIEYVQYVGGGHEPRVWNAADVLMGLFGGLLGSLFYARPRQ